MIIDAHTHVFPPDLIGRRAELLQTEPAFREVYPDENAALATADDVLRIVEGSELDAAVICNFAWTDLDRIRETNDYVLEAARASSGRLIPFCMVQAGADETHVRGEMKRVALQGARGIGELRPEQQGYSLVRGRAASLLAWGSSAYDLQLLIHVTEPVGHRYPGKPGAPMAEFAQFLNHHPEAQVIGAHWAGGLPFFSLMGDVRDDLDRVHVDSAASGLLYDDAVFRVVGELLGYEAILFASDYPLGDPGAEIARIRALHLRPEAEAAILGGNLQRLLQLADREPG